MPTNKDLEVSDPNLLLDKINAEFPQLKWADFVFLNHGWDHQVIILDKKIVFRFPNSQEYLDLLKNEINLLDFIAKKTKTRIPRYKYVAKDYSFGGYELITGSELTKEAFSHTAKDNQALIINQLADFISDLHSIDLNEVLSFSVATQNEIEDLDLLKLNVDKYLRKSLSKEDYEVVEDILNDVANIDTNDFDAVLVHADMSESHILWDEAIRQIGIIDFSDRSIGDPAHDFAELYYYGEEFVQNVYSKYRGPKDKNFLSRANVYYKRVGVFLLIDSFLTNKITFEQAKDIFDRQKTIN